MLKDIIKNLKKEKFPEELEFQLVNSNPKKYSNLYFMKKSYYLSQGIVSDMLKNYNLLTEDNDPTSMLYLSLNKLNYLKNVKGLDINKKEYNNHSLLTYMLSYDKECVNIEFIKQLKKMNFDFNQKVRNRNMAIHLIYFNKFIELEYLFRKNLISLPKKDYVHFFRSAVKSIDISPYILNIYKYIQDEEFLFHASAVGINVSSEKFEKINEKLYRVDSSLFKLQELFDELYNIKFIEKNNFSKTI